MSDPTVPEVGATYRLAEEDYKFGQGTLICTVTETLHLVRFDGQPWWHARGWCRFREIEKGRDRELYVRASAVRRSKTS